MNRFLPTVAATLVAASLSAQCFRTVDSSHLDLGNGDDALKAVQPLGFAFPFAGGTWTDVHISTNGFAYLSNGGTPAPGGANGTGTGGTYGTAAAQQITLVSGAPKVCAFYRDLNLLAANNGKVFVKTGSATEPCIITWSNAVDYGTTGPIKTIQCQLLPSGGVVMYYDGQTNVVGAAPATVGLSPGGGVALPAALDLSSSPVTTDDTAYETFATGTFDLSGSALQWLGTAPGWVAIAGSVPAGCANRQSFGTGCYDAAYTFYEAFPSLPAFDFPGTTTSTTVIGGTSLGGSGFLVATGASAFVQPLSAQVLNNAATPVAMTDDSYSQPLTLPFAFAFPGGTTNVIHASANGYLLLGSTTGNISDFTPTAAELVGGAPRLCALWCDLQPATNVATNAASGVYYDIDPSNQVVYVTWLDVADRRGALPAAGATSVTLQIALFANGQFEFRYGAITTGTGVGAVYTGFTPGLVGGQPSRDPGSRDLSAVLPLVVQGPDSVPLAHTTGLPVLGTTMNLSASSVPAVLPLAFVFVGDLAVPGGFDLAALGAPGCRAYIGGNIASASFAVTAGAGSFQLPIPNTASLGGLQLSSQVVAFSSANSLGLATSNGVSWTLGN